MKATGILLSVGVIGVAAIVAFFMNGSGRQTEEAQPAAAVEQETPAVEVALQQPEVPAEELLPEPEPEPDLNRMPPLDQLSFDNPITIIHHLFSGGEIGCLAAAEVNGDAVLDVGDPIYLLNYLFQGGPTLPNSGPLECGGN